MWPSFQEKTPDPFSGFLYRVCGEHGLCCDDADRAWFSIKPCQFWNTLEHIGTTGAATEAVLFPIATGSC